MKDKPNVFIICTGVGHINRGYESFTLECFYALKGNDDFDIYLLKGAGAEQNNEITISCIKRRSGFANLLSKLTKKENYWIEQFTFFIGMITSLIKYKPDVIYYSDFILGTFLFHLRRFFKFKYKLLFSNGAPNGPPFNTEDHVQQLLPVYLNGAIEAGAPPQKQTLLPYGFDIDINGRLANIDKKKAMMKELGLPEEKKIILSVGAINKYHKRMDYVINEVAKMPNDYFLVILGQFEHETPELVQLAADKLKGRHVILNVPYETVKKYYIASDYFVLASLIEGFGRVIVEALSYGLECIVHDYINAREVLGDCGNYINMKDENGLSLFLKSDFLPHKKDVLIKIAYERYSWQKLAPGYSKMIKKLI